MPVGSLALVLLTEARVKPACGWWSDGEKLGGSPDHRLKSVAGADRLKPVLGLRLPLNGPARTGSSSLMPMGWRMAALRAGIMPKVMPTPAEKLKAKATGQVGMGASTMLS